MKVKVIPDLDTNPLRKLFISEKKRGGKNYLELLWTKTVLKLCLCTNHTARVIDSLDTNTFFVLKFFSFFLEFAYWQLYVF